MVDTALLTLPTGISMSGAHHAPYVDAFGVSWLFTKDTWFDGVAAGDSGVTPRAAAIGGWAGPVWMGPKIIHVDGRLRAPTFDGATQAWDRLLAAIPISTLGPMTLFAGSGAVPTQRVYIRQHEAPTIGERNEGLLTFSLSLIAPDPRRYAITPDVVSTGLPVTTGGLSLPITLPISISATTVSGKIRITNTGNENAPIVFTITGPCAPAAITEVGTGRRLVIPQAVEAGRTLTIDTDSRRAYLDANTLRTVTGTWFDAKPGTTDLLFTAASYDPAAVLTATTYSAWR